MQNKITRTAIITGVVSGLLVMYLFNPIISFLGNLSIKLAGHVFKSYLDKVCLQLAKGEPNYSFQLFGMFFGFIAGTGIGYFAAYIAYIVKRKISEESKVTTPAIFSSSVISVCALIMTFVSIFMYVDGYIRIKAYYDFKQGLTIIGPYIDDSKQKAFLSRFSQMRNKKDYDLIMRDIFDVATQNKIKMPESISYSL